MKRGPRAPIVTVATGASVRAPAVAPIDRGFVITWLDPTGRVLRSRLGNFGDVVDVDAGVVSSANSTRQTLDRRTGSVLATSTATQIFLFPFDPDTGLVMMPATTIASAPEDLSVARYDGGIGVVWTETGDAGRDVRLAVFPSALVAPSFSVLQTGAENPSPIAFVETTGELRVVVGNGDVVRLFSPNAAPAVLSNRSLQLRPTSAMSNGSFRFVLMQNGQRLQFGAVTGPGVSLEREGFARAPGHHLAHDVDAVGRTATVLFRRLGLFQNDNQALVVAQLRDDGVVAAPPRVVLTDCCSTTVAVAARTSDFLMMRRALRASSVYEGEVGSLTVSPPGFVAFDSPDAGATEDGVSVTLSKGGADLALWRNSRHIVAWRVLQSRSDVASVVTWPALTAAGEPSSPAAARVAGGWWVTWLESGSVRGVLVSDGPVLSASMPRVLGAAATSEPSLSSVGPDALLLFGAGVTVRATRLFADGGASALPDVGTSTDKIEWVHHAPLDAGFLASWVSWPAPTSVRWLDADGAAASATVSVGPGDVREPRVAATTSPVVVARAFDAPSLTWQLLALSVDLTRDLDGGVDAGTSTDAGELDAGTPTDAGQRDAGTSMDAGAPDGGAPVRRDLTVGCGCATGAWPLLLALTVLLRRRRRAH